MIHFIVVDHKCVVIIDLLVFYYLLLLIRRYVNKLPIVSNIDMSGYKHFLKKFSEDLTRLIFIENPILTPKSELCIGNKAVF